MGRHRFPWARDRIMSKLLRFPKENAWRRYKGLNNNILSETITFNNHFRGGRPALPSDGLPHGGSVVTGKPGIRLAHSSSGLAHSLLPALCRQDTSCAWRSRLRTRCTTTDLDDLIVWIGSCCCEVVAAKMQNSMYLKIAAKPVRSQ